MDGLWYYFVHNFILICLSLVLLIISIQRFRQHSRISVCTVFVVLIAIVLSIVVQVQDYARTNGRLYLALTTGILGYSLRPLCVYLLILMSDRSLSKKALWLSSIPLILNLIVYLCAYIPGAETIIFGYVQDSPGSALQFTGGFLRYSSHLISALYLIILLCLSFASLKSMHLEHGIAILICSAFTVAAVIVEMLDSSDQIELLNVTIVASTMVYYLFLYMERTQIDTLTGLFNRETYYRDSLKMALSATGVIQFDMNGLKYINDNMGHLEGDKALSVIAATITKSVRRGMYVYRLGGDEFLVIANNCSEEDIQKTISRFKELLSKTPYHCSTGYAYRPDKTVSFTDLLKGAEREMYIDKEAFYRDANIERRKAEKA